MDAVEYEKYRIKMCKEMILKKGGCGACEMYDVVRLRCRTPASVCMKEDEDYYKKNVAIVEQWSKDHPIKTRKSEFLKMFPNADIDSILPCDLDKNLKRGHCHDDDEGCFYCKQNYWNEEVSE